MTDVTQFIVCDDYVPYAHPVCGRVHVQALARFAYEADAVLDLAERVGHYRRIYEPSDLCLVRWTGPAKGAGDYIQIAGPDLTPGIGGTCPRDFDPRIASLRGEILIRPATYSVAA